MSLKDILVHVDSTPASRTRIRLSLALARQFDARLSGLHVIPHPEVPPYFKPSAIERIARIYEQNAHAAARRAEICRVVRDGNHFLSPDVGTTRAGACISLSQIVACFINGLGVVGHITGQITADPGRLLPRFGVDDWRLILVSDEPQLTEQRRRPLVPLRRGHRVNLGPEVRVDVAPVTPFRVVDLRHHPLARADLHRRLARVCCVVRDGDYLLGPDVGAARAGAGVRLIELGGISRWIRV